MDELDIPGPHFGPEKRTRTQHLRTLGSKAVSNRVVNQEVSRRIQQAIIDEEVERTLQLVQTLGPDTYDDKTVICFEVQHDEGKRMYRYAAIKAGGRWWITGATFQSMHWIELMTVIASGYQERKGYDVLGVVASVDTGTLPQEVADFLENPSTGKVFMGRPSPTGVDARWLNQKTGEVKDRIPSSLEGFPEPS